MDKPNPAALLKNVPLFRSAGPLALQRLVNKARERNYREKEVVFRRGELGSTMLVVAAGEVRLTRVGVTGREHALRLLRRGDVFGEIAMLDGRPRTTDAIADTNVTLLELERTELLEVMHDDHELAIGIVMLLCQRLRATDLLLEAMLFHDAAARLATTLLTLTRGRPGARIEITQQSLGEMAGATRETVNKKLREWQQAGLLALEPGRIRLLDHAALRAMIPGEQAGELEVFGPA